jgi:HlyD family secretion protein
MQPRPEEVPASQAQVDLAESNLREMEDHYSRAKAMLKVPGAITEEDVVQSKELVSSARAQLDLAKANLSLLKAGAWKPNIEIAASGVAQAKAQVDQAQTMLDLLKVRAPVKGTVLQVNVRPGEFVSTFGGQSLIVMGNLQPLHIRVNVDEEDLPRLRFDAPAQAKIRGDSTQEEVNLSFVRVEPYIVPKTSLTGQNTERVDTRVVQLIYAVDPSSRLIVGKNLFVGQLVDVYIDTGYQSKIPPIYDDDNVFKRTFKSDQIK